LLAPFLRPGGSDIRPGLSLSALANIRHLTELRLVVGKRLMRNAAGELSVEIRSARSPVSPRLLSMHQDPAGEAGVIGMQILPLRVFSVSMRVNGEVIVRYWRTMVNSSAD
jgi:hypothetical protein